MRRHWRHAVVVAFAALVALGCKQNAIKPNPIETASDSADQVLEAFHHFVTADGVRQSEIEADTAFFFDATQKTLLRKMRVEFFDTLGAKQATVVAARGEYLWQTGSMVAESAVVMTTTDGKVIKSQKLVFDQAKQEISTDVPFEYQDSKGRLQGDGFTSDRQFKNIKVKKPRGTSTEGMAMPGQENPPADSGAKP